MNDIELKLKLAGELPELIRIDYLSGGSFNRGSKVTFYWLDTGEKVTEREWDRVVNEIVKTTMTNWELLSWRQHISENTLATWQQRAEAYFKVKEQK